MSNNISSFIFPTTEQENLASEKEFTGINWDDLAVRLASTNDEQATLPENLTEILAEKYSEDDAEVKTAGKCPEHLKEFQFTSKSNEDTKEANDEKEEKEACSDDEENNDEKKEARVRKIRFTSAEELSAEALEAAEKAGNIELAEAIVAARKERRTSLASKVEASDEKDEKIAKRHAYRENIVKQYAEKVASRQDERLEVVAEIEDGLKKVATASETAKEDDFKKVAEMNSQERNAFIKKAEACGFPKNYIEQMLGDNDKTELAPVELEMREIMTASISENAKRTAIAALVKEAKLDSEQIARQMRYWTEELGYDKEWAAKLFKTDYDTTPKSMASEE